MKEQIQTELRETKHLRASKLLDLKQIKTEAFV